MDIEHFQILGASTSAFFAQVALIFSLTVLFGFAAKKILKYLQEMSSLPEWLRTLSATCSGLSAWLIWGWGILFAAEASMGRMGLDISSELLEKIRSAFTVGFLLWMFLKWKEKYEKTLKNRVKNSPSKLQDEQLITAVGKVVTISILILSGIFFLDLIGIQMTAILAFGGIGGVAVGFAAKDIVANFFGGFMIHINRHFSVGEWIISPNKHFEGTVEEIGWYMTKIRSFARRPVFIPNAVFIDAIIENPGRMYNRRIKETIGIRYEDSRKLQQIVDAIREMLLLHPAIDQEKTLFVHFAAFGASSLDIEVDCFTKTTNGEEWRAIQQEILLKILGIVESNEAELAYPTSVVHLKKDEQSGTLG